MSRIRQLFFISFFVGLGTVLLSSCVSYPRYVPPPVKLKPVKQEKPNLSPYLSHDYHFVGGIGDTLQLTLLEEDRERQYKLRIDPDGKISVPLAGRMRAAGRSLEAIQSEMTEKLKPYFYEPDVSLQWFKIVSSRVTILGSVYKPGVYVQTAPRRLSAVLARVGGVRTHPVTTAGQRIPAADLQKAFVRRKGEVISPDFAALIRGDAKQDIWVLPGDSVYVPDKREGQYFVLGEVHRPGRYMTSKKLHLFELIAEGGGLKETASKSFILIRGTLSKPKVFRVPYDDILQAKARSIYLRPGDVVYVPPTGLTKMNRVVQKIAPLVGMVTGIGQTAIGVGILNNALR